MKTTRYCIGLFIILILSGKLYGHGYENFSWTTINTFGIYDMNNDRLFQSFDINSAFLIFNGGLNYKNFNYIDSKKISIYVGLGIGNFLQFQTGFLGEGSSIRARSDWVMGYLSNNFAKKHPYWALTTFSINVERYFNNAWMKWSLGLGIGFSINNSKGFKFFK
jgi:hypothetical protein